jgi:hypothetical protein
MVGRSEGIIPHDKVIYSVKHNTYIVVISTQLATCFGSGEPSSGSAYTDTVHSVSAHIMGSHVYKPFLN